MTTLLAAEEAVGDEGCLVVGRQYLGVEEADGLDRTVSPLCRDEVAELEGLGDDDDDTASEVLQLPLRAIPTARPIEARTAAKDTDFTPSTPAKKRKRAMYRIEVKTESRSETATPSILRRRRIPLKIFFRRVMTTLPSQKRTTTRMTRSPKLIPALSHSSSMLRLNQCLMSRLRGCVASSDGFLELGACSRVSW